MNCCNDFGQCTQGADCAIRGCSQAKGRENVAIWVKAAKKRNEPTNDTPPLGKFEDFCEYFVTTLLPWTLGIALGAVLMLSFLLGFSPI